MPADYQFAERIHDACRSALAHLATQADYPPDGAALLRECGLDVEPWRIATLCAAQACYESGWGRHYPHRSHNPFGIQPAGHASYPGYPHLRQFDDFEEACLAWLHQITGSAYYRDLRTMALIRARDTGRPLDGPAWRAWIVAYAKIYCPHNDNYANVLLQVLHQVERHLEPQAARDENTKPVDLPPLDERLDIEAAIRDEAAAPYPSGDMHGTRSEQSEREPMRVPRSQGAFSRMVRYLWPFGLIALTLAACAHRTLDTPSGYHASETVLLGRSSLRLTSGTLTISYGARPDLNDLSPLLEALARGAAEGAR